MNVGDRIKEFYEDRTKQLLMRRTITILRLDGKGFSKFTKGLNKPFDDGFSEDMDLTAKFLCEEIQGAKFGYTQSDEITIVISDFDNQETSAWFDFSVQKMVSISASIATAKFNQLRMARACNNADGDLRENMLADYDIKDFKLAMFDSRVFQVPTIDEMVNTLIFRQQDCTRNSISMAADALLKGSMEGVKGDVKQDRLFKEAGVNWNDYKTKYKRGSVIKKIEIDVATLNGVTTRKRWVVDEETPIFTQDKDYLIKFITNSL
jgi:tRNA(His) guanylyltransferase